MVVMKRIITVILICVVIFSCLTSNSDAQELVVIKTSDIKPYNEALKGFKSACNGDMRKLEPGELESPEVLKDISIKRPALIFAIGLNALLRAKRIKDIPVVYAMVSNPQAVLSGEQDITGVSMNIPARTQLEAFLKFVPNAKKIGIIYNPENTVHLFNEARTAANAFGATVISEEIHGSREVPAAINTMAGKIDSFWLLPDTTVITPASIDFLLLFSYENKIPVLTFSDKYVEKGFFMSLNMDARDIGVQACEMAEKILKGTGIGKIPPGSPRKASLFLNMNTAKQLGISMKSKTVQENNIYR
jgi:putative ABC transport system substrate-binding protein